MLGEACGELNLFLRGVLGEEWVMKSQYSFGRMHGLEGVVRVKLSPHLGI